MEHTILRKYRSLGTLEGRTSFLFYYSIITIIECHSLIYHQMNHHHHPQKNSTSWTPHYRYLPRKWYEDIFFRQQAQRMQKGQRRPVKGPVSKSEPTYNPDKWNKPDTIKWNHNCYSYATETWAPKRTSKAQPGYFSGFDSVPDKSYQCLPFLMRIARDNPGFLLASHDASCPVGFHKAFLALAPEGDDIDYHFYRQDADGSWSHKPGATETTQMDASGKRIMDPLLANREYPVYKYKQPCFYFCVHPKLAHTSSLTLPRKFTNNNYQTEEGNTNIDNWKK